MAEQHLADLEHALAQRGWTTTDTRETPGSRRWGISGSWEITRGDRTLVLEFEGADADGLITYPLERAYACRVRGHEELSIYFGRRSSSEWPRVVDAFVSELDGLTR